MSDGPELFPIAIGWYRNFEKLSVDDEMAAIGTILAEFDFHTVGWDVTMAARDMDAVDARLQQWSESGAEHSILYWVGHGWSDDRDTALAHVNSPRHVRSRGISPQRIADAIAARNAAPDSWMIVVIDACQSGSFVRSLKSEISQRPGRPSYLLIGGMNGDGATELGRFSDALRFCLHTVCAADYEIPLHKLARHFENADAEVEQKRLLDGIVLRRRHAVLVNIDLDSLNELNAALAGLDSDELRHFLPKAHGGDMPFEETMLGEQSWYFEGRHVEAGRIVSWLDDPTSGMFVVTGAAGCGKSALLGQLVVHANPTLRTALRRANLLDERSLPNQPPDNAFDAVIHLTGSSTQDVIARIATSAEVTIPAEYEIDRAVKHLADRLNEHKQFTILTDALDEAIDPLTIAERVLRVLAEVATVHILVGTRASTYEDPDRPAPDTNLLDALGANPRATMHLDRDSTAVHRYVRKRLRAARQHDELAAQLDIDAFADAVRARDPHFLFARLVVHELLADPGARTPTGWQRLLAGEHRDLFATAVARLETEHPANRPLLQALAYSRGRGLPAADDIWATVAHTLADDVTITAVEVDHLTVAAAAYVLTDREHGQTVYRLAHRTFAEHFTNETEPTERDRVVHSAIARSLIDQTERGLEDAVSGRRPLNPYLARLLTGHIASAGRSGWQLLNDHPRILVGLEPDALAIDATRSAFGRFDLSSEISGIVTTSQHLQSLSPRERHVPIQLAAARHRGSHASEANAFDPALIFGATVHFAVMNARPAQRVLSGDGITVSAMTVLRLRDGRTILAAAGSEVWLWDLESGQPQGQRLAGHYGIVRALAVVATKERTLLASADAEGTIRLWDAATGRPHGQPLVGHIGSVDALASITLRDGRSLLLSAGVDETVRVWDPVAGCAYEPPRQLSWWQRRDIRRSDRKRNGYRYPPQSMVVFESNDGRVFVATTLYGRSVWLWELHTPRFRGRRLRGHTDRVLALTTVTLPYRRVLLASGGRDKKVRLWDLTAGRRSGRAVVFHKGWVQQLAEIPFPNGQPLLAVAGTGGTVDLWDPSTGLAHGQPIAVSTRWTNDIAVVTLPDGRALLAHIGNDNDVQLLDLVSGQAHGQTLTGHTEQVQVLVAVPLRDGRTLLASGDTKGTVRLWDPSTAKAANGVTSGRGITALAEIRLPHGRTVLASGAEDTVRLWDLERGDHPGPIADHLAVQALATVATPNDRSLLAIAGVRGVQFWDPVTEQLRPEPITGHKDDSAMALAVVPLRDGRIVLAGAYFDSRFQTRGARRKLRLWDADTGLPYGQPLPLDQRGDADTGLPYGQPLPLDEHRETTFATINLPDGTTLLAATVNNGVQVWDPTSGEPYNSPPIRYHGNAKALVAVHLSDGRILLAAAIDDRVHVWDFATGELHQRSLTIYDKPTPADTTAAYSWPSGNRYSRPITDLALITTPGAPTLLAGAFGDRVQFWDPETGEPRGRIFSGGTRWAHTITTIHLPDGRPLLATAGAGSAVRLWDPYTCRPHGRRLTGHTGRVLDLAEVRLSDGRVLLASASKDKTVRLWDPAAGIPVGQPIPCRAAARALVSFIPGDGMSYLMFLTAGNPHPQIWNVTSGEALRRTINSNPDENSGPYDQPPYISAMTTLRVRGGRPMLVTAHEAGQVQLWDPETTLLHTEFDADEDSDSRVEALAPIHLPEGKALLAVVGVETPVRLWDAATGRPDEVQLTQTIVASALAEVPLAHGRSLLATADRNGGTVRLWDPTTGEPYGQPLIGHSDRTVLAAVRRTDGRTVLASADSEGTIRLWDLTDGEPDGSAAMILHVGAAVRNLCWVGDLLAVGIDGLAVLRIHIGQVERPAQPIPPIEGG
ncbi:hypothetical protein [Nocardia sp. CA-120079]|uniref:hypothetical protein n=1 Tax=Nocardia sp. CA-120079 TaxID=3239974 RepID=UPI003D96F257